MIRDCEQSDDCFYNRNRPTRLFHIISARRDTRARGHFRAVCRIVMATWESKSQYVWENVKKDEKKSARSFLWTRWGSEKVCQPPVEETKPKQSGRVSVHVNCVCVQESADWENVGFLQELTKPWKRVMTESGEHTPSLMWAHMPAHVHTRTLARAHEDAFTLTNAIKAVTADGDT